MAESIQIDALARRRCFLIDAAELYGRPLAAPLEEIDPYADDTAALLLAFPWLSDAELTEALWALAHAEPRSWV
jgi:hypothetical protein